MHTITFISTIHDEIGNCNDNELSKIIGSLNPEVIFLEATEETYTTYEHLLFLKYGVYHKKLELSAIQKYCETHSFEYVPVCGNYLSEAFHQKNTLVCKNTDLQKLIEKSIFLAETYGFNFLNSVGSMNLQEEMRTLESRILEGSDLERNVNENLDNYENLMIQNIYSYSKNHQFNSAIFMCGAAHRKSIMAKIEKINLEEEIKLDWIVYSD